MARGNLISFVLNIYAGSLFKDVKVSDDDEIKDFHIEEWNKIGDNY